MTVTTETVSLEAGHWGEGAAAWESIVRRMPLSSPYLSKAWTDAWIRTFGPSLKPRQLVVTDGSGLPIGTCLLTAQTRRSAVLPHVRMHVNTDGESPADSVIVEHNGLLAVPGAEAAVAHAVAAQVGAMRVDELRLSGAPEAEVNRVCQALADWVVDVEWKDSPYVNLDAMRIAGRDHVDLLSSNTREQLRRSLGRYRQRGEIRLKVAASADEALSMFEQLTALHDARWQAVGQQGGFATPLRRAFHRAFVQDGTRSGNAQLLSVSVGDEVIGVLYNLVANGRVNFYQAGFRYERDKHLKPGMVVHHLAIMHCLQAGMSEYDFLPSAPGEGRYKTSLSDSNHRLAVLTLSRPGWRRNVFNAARALRDSCNARRDRTAVHALPSHALVKASGS